MPNKFHKIWSMLDFQWVIRSNNRFPQCKRITWVLIKMVVQCVFLNKLINKLLTILTEKDCVLLSSVLELIEIEAWLLLTFFICLLYVYFIRLHQIKWTVAPCSKFCDKIRVGFYLNTGKNFFLEVSF